MPTVTESFNAGPGGAEITTANSQAFTVSQAVFAAAPARSGFSMAPDGFGTEHVALALFTPPAGGVIISTEVWCHVVSPGGVGVGLTGVSILGVTASPDLITITGAVNIELAFRAVDGSGGEEGDLIITSNYTADGSSPVVADDTPLWPLGQWVRVSVDWTATTVRTRVRPEAGDTVFDHTFVAAPARPNYIGIQAGLSDVLDVHLDDFTYTYSGGGALPVRTIHPTRCYPRDDGTGMSSAPRLYPPPRSGRVFGGHQ